MTKPASGFAPATAASWRWLRQDGLALSLAVAVLALWPLVLLAFWPRYLSRMSAADGYLHTHAMLGTAWLLLLVAQPLLVRARRFAAHRALGRIGVALGVAFVATGVLSAHRLLAGMDEARFARDGFFLYMILATTAIFAAALWLGVRWRKSPAVHGRFMACTLLPLLDPVFARILGMHFPPLPAAFLYQLPALLATVAVLAVLLLSLPRNVPGRAHFAWFAGIATGVLLVFFAVEHNPTWLAFVAWFRSLPLT